MPRLELAGTLIHPVPLVVRFDTVDIFYPPTYMTLDYTHFEVICIGAGGGNGGGIDTENTGTLIRNYGGAGGGGGFHRVRGLLSALPISCDIVVGVPGVDGDDHISNPALTTNGSDGGYSSFNDTTCRASGGKGGRRAQTNSTSLPTLADGGDGGIGNRSIAGGGADGGTTGVNGADGTYFNNIGEGGGGGAGGVGLYDSGIIFLATAGGRGSYNPSNTSVYGPGDLPSADPDSGVANIVPGIASGAKASPLNGLPTVYGKTKMAGIVILRLTSE